jgi:tetratricopeptide (TPR) repeat protein
MTKRWTKVEVAFLEKHAGDRTLAELAERFRTDSSTVQKKLDELRKAAPASKAGDVLEDYQNGLKALYAGDWKTAIDHLERVLQDDSSDLAARARQYVTVARQRAADAGSGPEDPWVRAVFEKNRGALDAALALCLAEGRVERDGRFAYLAAVVCTLRGDAEGARQHLDRAVELDPRNRAHALHDPDLRALDDQPAG